MNKHSFIFLRPIFGIALLSIAFHGHTQNLSQQRNTIRTAITAAEAGTLTAAQRQAVANHPLYDWIQVAEFKRQLSTAPNAEIVRVLNAVKTPAAAANIREMAFPELVKRQDWNTLLTYVRPDTNVMEACVQLHAQAALGKFPADWNQRAQTIWLSSGNSLSSRCDPVFALLSNRGGLTDELRWQRFDLALEAGQSGVMKSIAKGLPAVQQPLANQYADFIQTYNATALNWPKTPRSQAVVVKGLEQYAKKNADTVESLLPQFRQALGLTTEQQNQIRYAVALWSAASYSDTTQQRLEAVPLAAYDERLHEWRVRSAMVRSDWAGALSAIRAMPTEQQSDSRWQYFAARMLEKTGRANEATGLFQKAAQASTFHGFLAADRLNQGYALCQWQPNDPASIATEMANNPAITRAIELFLIERNNWALREWNLALKGFNDAQRRAAVRVAVNQGWLDRAIFSLGKQPDELRLYDLRFPWKYDAAIRNYAAQNNLDPMWVAAEIRAESLFNPKARSPADARGLMQILPATGAEVARKIGQPFSGGNDLYQPDANIQLGTAYLRQLLERNGAPYITIAAYNAGPGAAKRWTTQRPNMDPDIWIETIPYKETRDYVARVLLFSVIYDWKQNKNVTPVTARMQGQTNALPKKVGCI